VDVENTQMPYWDSSSLCSLFSGMLAPLLSLTTQTPVKTARARQSHCREGTGDVLRKNDQTTRGELPDTSEGACFLLLYVPRPTSFAPVHYLAPLDGQCCAVKSPCVSVSEKEEIFAAHRFTSRVSSISGSHFATGQGWNGPKIFVSPHHAEAMWETTPILDVTLGAIWPIEEFPI
jgi:hypothetical protein